MAGSTFFFTGKDPIRLAQSELGKHYGSRLAIIEIAQDGGCYAHFWMPKSRLGGKWYTYGPIRICFLSNDKAQRVLDDVEAWRTINDISQSRPFVDVNSKDLKFSFVTMGLEAMDYRALVDHLGNHPALEACLTSAPMGPHSVIC